jgi:hypothetical protein
MWGFVRQGLRLESAKPVDEQRQIGLGRLAGLAADAFRQPHAPRRVDALGHA